MKTHLATLTVLCLSASATLVAGDVFRRIPLSQLPQAEEGPSGPGRDTFEERNLLTPVMSPYVVLESNENAEAYVETATRSSWESPAVNNSFLAVRSPSDRDVAGTIYFPKPNRSGMNVIPFKLTAADKTSEPKEFYRAKEDHYRDLLQGNLPGTAWFRHQADEAARAQGSKPAETAAPNGRDFRRNPELEDTYDLFTGGRAVSENLQLDRLMNIRGDNKTLVDLASLKDIQTKEMDWKALVKDITPAPDPLASRLPADQHALFFPSFEAMTRLLDEAQANGTPVLHLLEPKAEDTGTQARYQKQLCAGLNDLSRLLGPKVIDSIAFTGSDPYLRVGTDVTVVFETKQPEVLKTLIGGRQALAQQGNPAVKAVSGQAGGIAYAGVVSPDRSVCSYLAVINGAVVVTNSLTQIEILADVAAGKRPALASLDEYTFFRHRYARTDREETAFLVLSDATIRRWCSPRWRIADSRRTLAAAALNELQALNFEALVNGKANEGPIANDFPNLELGATRLTKGGPTSEVYGGLGFMTPISELSLAKVTQAEADAYNRWREGYERNWSQFFDPIAVRFSVSQKKLGAEITVMPLIAGSEYRDLINITKDAKIQPLAGDPHDAILHGITAVNVQAEPVVSLGRSISPLMPGVKANPFAWLGQSVSYYADEDPFWERMLKADSQQAYLLDHYYDLPVAINAEVAKPLELALFLAGLRAMVEQTSPGLTTWSTQDHNGKPYVKIAATGANGDFKKLCLYYATTPKSLIVTVNENVLKRALDRQEARSRPDYQPDATTRPWLGESQSFQAGPRALAVAQQLTRDSYHLRLQALSWANLPILNEWKRLHPDQDPLKLHEERWGVKLVCPGGGTYSWNAEWNTMESSVFGHPGQPRDNLKTPVLFSFTSANLGLTFEPNGLSAKAVIERPGK